MSQSSGDTGGDANSVGVIEDDGVEDPSNTGDLSKISSIWEDDKIEKFIDANGKKKWKCLWCNNAPFGSWNASKALAHVSKTSGHDIKPCTSFRIDDAHRHRYLKLVVAKNDKKKCRSNTNNNINEAIDLHNITSATRLMYSKKKSRTGPSSASTPSTHHSTGTSSSGFGGLQLQLPNMSMSGRDADCQLTMAIADLIHSRGLSFSLASDPKFKYMLLLAKNSSSVFVPPPRHQIANELLDLNYSIYMEKSRERLLNESGVYGLAIFGDGATIKKTPYFNILASGVHSPATCLEIVDCSEHLSGGGKKDATYISQQIIPYIQELEQHEQNLVDLVIFDGASNVQLAGTVLAVLYPRLTVLHGAEHVISLFFGDVFKQPEMILFIKISQLAYKYFGSGAMHAPYSYFQKYSRQHNNGRKIGLIWASDTRMGGHVIALLWMLRLKDALKQTVTSREFASLKVTSIDIPCSCKMYSRTHPPLVMLSPYLATTGNGKVYFNTD